MNATVVKSSGRTGAKTTSGRADTSLANNARSASQAERESAAPTQPKARRTTRTPAESRKTTGDIAINSGKADSELADTITDPVVLKASEVATKTNKISPATPANGTLLTEEQILKMSDKDYMNEAQLAFFKARLQQLERDLLKNAGETTEHLRETVLVPDPADRATIEEEHALELRTRDRERKLLKKVQQSIASIDNGEYGWCEETGEPIGVPRLLARPTATLSLEAQQRRELKQKMYGD